MKNDSTQQARFFVPFSRGQFRFLFLKRASDRTASEREHIDSLLQNTNANFLPGKRRRQHGLVFDQVGDCIWLGNFPPLMDWFRNLDRGWDTLKNYFLIA